MGLAGLVVVPPEWDDLVASKVWADGEDGGAMGVVLSMAAGLSRTVVRVVVIAVAKWMAVVHPVVRKTMTKAVTTS